MARRASLLLSVILLFLSLTPSIVWGDEPNVGMVRVYEFNTPNQVAPGSVFSVSIGVEYELRPDNATIRTAIYSGAVNINDPTWQSDEVVVHGGGDWIWNASLTAPSTEGYLNLTAVGFFLDQGRWIFYNNSNNGPGFVEETIKIAKSANIEVELGKSGLPVTVGDKNVNTSPNGEAQFLLPVGATYIVKIPSIFELQNSTRIAFMGWSDGNNQTQRNILLNGDVKLIASYKNQYLLRVNSPLSSNATWCDSGSIAQVYTSSSLPMNWPLGLLGLRYNFVGWVGSVNSQATELNVTMDAPKTLNANFSVDYGSALLPAIILVGIVGAVIVPLLRRRRMHLEEKEQRISVEQGAMEQTPSIQPPEEQPQVSETSAGQTAVAEESMLTCTKCGDDIEKDWTYCIHCGQKLAGFSPTSQ